MKVRSFGKTAAAGLAAILTVGALTVTAQADPPPSGTIAGAGSDTTQDVVQALAVASSGVMESWNAGNNNTIVVSGVTVSRPNGSGQGLAALRRSLGASVSTPWATNPVPVGSGVFDFARSSSAPSASELSTTGELVYVPMAIDRVRYATHASGSAPTSLTQTNLQQLYSTGSTVVSGTTLTATTWNGSAAVIGDVTLYIPQDGSGTRSYWAGLMGISATSLPNWVFDRYVPATGLPTKLTTGTIVQEHDGTVLQEDLDGTEVALVPYSVSQYTAQENFLDTGVEDRRHGAVLRGPTNSRTVYNVVSHAAVTNPASPVYEAFNAAASGGAEACDSSIITLYGFQTTASCGVISNANRVRLTP